MWISLLFLILFCACAILQCGFWVVLFGRLATHPHKVPLPSGVDLPPVSVIICAYNELHNLRERLPHILAQAYPRFEVLIVDDASTDGSLAHLQSLADKHPQLRILPLNYPHGKPTLGKKHALSRGISASKYDTLLVTDADCKPSGTDWLRIMAGTLRDDKEIALGYGPYEKQPGILNAFIRFEAVYTAIQYFSFALWGIAYMGVGRNMAYHKRLFHRAGGFEGHKHIPSGDDDLFVNAVAGRDNVACVLDAGAFAPSPAKESWKAYFRQKSRHVSTGRHYRPLHQVLLGMLSASHLGLYVFGICNLYGHFHWLAGAVMGVVLVCKWFVFSRIARKLGENDLSPAFVFLDAIYVLYYIILTPALFWGQTTRWK